MTLALNHHQSSLASAVFDLDDAVVRRTWGSKTWAVFLDASLPRWEVFIDAPNGRVFVNEDTWCDLDGRAQVAFEDDFIQAYRGTAARELRTLVDEVYLSAARRQAAAEGTDRPPETDRIQDLQRRAEEAVVAAAGAGGALSATQSQVFTTRHAQLVADLAALEEDMERLRSAVALSDSVVRRALG